MRTVPPNHSAMIGFPGKLVFFKPVGMGPHFDGARVRPEQMRTPELAPQA
jgi:hypothetical protein